MPRAPDVSRTAHIYPGQGSQYVGMLKDIAAAHAQAAAMIEQADAILGVPLSSICFNGPERELRQTVNTQPAIFLHGVVLARLLGTQTPDMVAGHSLGEYTALVAAGALTFEDGLRLVRLRGELMHQAGLEQHGTMAATVGLPDEVVEEICREASSEGIVQTANFNSPGQVVISGSVAGVHRAMELARSRGAKMVKELVVSGAFHSPLMESARKGLRAALDSVAISDARIPVYSNVSAEPVTWAAEIRETLYRQLTSPVRWEQSVRNMLRDGASRFIEIGPGKVLQGLVRRISHEAQVSGVDTLGQLAAWTEPQ